MADLTAAATLGAVDNQADEQEAVESLKALVAAGSLETSTDNQAAHESDGFVVVEMAKAPEQSAEAEQTMPPPLTAADENCDADDEESEEEVLDRRMTYIGEGLLDVGGMDAIDRLTNDATFAELESLAAESATAAAAASSSSSSTDSSPVKKKEVDIDAMPESDLVAAPATPSPAPVSSKLQAFLAMGSAQKQSVSSSAPPADTPKPKPATAPRPFPPLAPTQAPTVAPAPAKPQLETVQIENRRSKLLDFLANDVGERYLDGVYQEEARDDSADEEEAAKKDEPEQELDRQRRVQRANSKLVAFLAQERGERLHRVERGSEDEKRSSMSSEASSTASSVIGTEMPRQQQERQQRHEAAQAQTPNKLLEFVSKVVPEKPKMMIFNPSDAASDTEDLELYVAEEARKKKQKREDREKARQKVMAFLAEENANAAGSNSTVKSVDESKVQREKVVDRYGREGLLDFLDRTEAVQQSKIRWATSRSSSHGSSSPANSVTSSPKAVVSPQNASSPASSATSRSETMVTPPRSAPPTATQAAPSRPPHSGNRLASFLSKITSKGLSSSPPSSKKEDKPLKPLAVPPRHESTPAAKQVPAASESVSSVSAGNVDAGGVHPSSNKMLPVLAALDQISQTCASHELNDVSIARITTLLTSISQIVKDDVQKKTTPARRWSNAAAASPAGSASPSWVKSGKEIEEFDKKHALVKSASVPPTPAKGDARSASPAVLERSSDLKVTVASTVLHSFNEFELSQNLLEVVSTFHKLLADCGLTDLKLEQPWAVYDHVKAAVAPKLGFRQKQLFKLLDAKLHGEVAVKKPAARKRVCIIGAGPVGLRAAVEMALLGAQVVVLEKRKHFSRENILHLWPWVVQDLTSLGAKVLFPQFCHSTAYFHVGTRQLQCILLKVALLLGVTFFPSTTFEGIAHPDAIDSGRRPFYTVVTNPQIPWMEFTAILGACGTQDRLSDQARIKRFVFSRKEAIGLVCYFPNHGTAEEKNVPEFSWTIQFKQQMFAKLRAIGVDLENIVYYRGEMHYLVMTPKRQNLLDQGVMKLDYPNVADLVMDDNINKPVLHAYLKRVVDFVKIPQKSEFARVRIFDFSSRTRADKAASILTSKGKKLYVGLIGDSLIEPFWPEGLGTCRGFLSALDGCWMVAQVGFRSDEQLLADRELAYRIIQHVSGFRREDLQKNVRKYDVDPKTRYTVKFPQLC